MVGCLQQTKDLTGRTRRRRPTGDPHRISSALPTDDHTAPAIPATLTRQRTRAPHLRPANSDDCSSAHPPARFATKTTLRLLLFNICSALSAAKGNLRSDLNFSHLTSHLGGVFFSSSRPCPGALWMARWVLRQLHMCVITFSSRLRRREDPADGGMLGMAVGEKVVGSANCVVRVAGAQHVISFRNPRRSVY